MSQDEIDRLVQRIVDLPPDHPDVPALERRVQELIDELPEIEMPPGAEERFIARWREAQAACTHDGRRGTRGGLPPSSDVCMRCGAVVLKRRR